MPDSDNALSLLKLTSAVGLGDIVGTVTHDAPLMNNILDTIRVRMVLVDISLTASNCEFADWSVDVELTEFNIIPGKVSLRNVFILL